MKLEIFPPVLSWGPFRATIFRLVQRLVSVEWICLQPSSNTKFTSPAPNGGYSGTRSFVPHFVIWKSSWTNKVQIQEELLLSRNLCVGNSVQPAALSYIRLLITEPVSLRNLASLLVSLSRLLESPEAECEWVFFSGLLLPETTNLLLPIEMQSLDLTDLWLLLERRILFKFGHWLFSVQHLSVFMPNQWIMNYSRLTSGDKVILEALISKQGRQPA